MDFFLISSIYANAIEKWKTSAAKRSFLLSSLIRISQLKMEWAKILI